MSYSLYSEDGFLGDLATVEGYSDLMGVLDQSSSPLIQDFVKEGFSPDLAGLLRETKILVFKAKLGPETKQVLDNFMELLSKAKEAVIVSDGLAA